MISLTRRLAAGVAPEYFCKNLKDRGTNVYFGCPEASLKGFAAYASQIADQHIVTSNEGSAISMAAGHYLATGSIPMVYFQNTGVGNAMNPLLSLAHKHADKIPLLMLIAWRGMQDSNDYPQHQMVGLHIQNILTVLGIPFSIMFPCDDPEFNTELVLDKAFNQLHANHAPFAILAERGSFQDLTLPSEKPTAQTLNRREAVQNILNALPSDAVVIGGPGSISKDVAAARIKANSTGTADYLAIGAREHCASIAEGMALTTPSRKFVCLEHGYGVSQFASPPICGNVKRIILRRPHDFDCVPLASALGYSVIATQVGSPEELTRGVKGLLDASGPALLEVLVSEGSEGEEVIKYNAGVIQKQLQNKTKSSG
eukprot:gene8261-5781_t